MKLLYKLVRNGCVGVFSIYGINTAFKAINFVVPINFFTLGMSSIFGFFGIIGVIIIKLLI